MELWKKVVLGVTACLSSAAMILYIPIGGRLYYDYLITLGYTDNSNKVIGMIVFMAVAAIVFIALGLWQN